MSLSSQHITDVFAYLNSEADYAVLRNYEGLPDSNSSRDIDIIITRSSLRKVRKGIVDIIQSGGWQIVNYLDSDRLVTFVCGRCDDGKVELVQWDFFVNTSVWGLQLMSAEEFLQHKQFNGFLYYVGVEAQFLDKYLYNRTVGAPYPAKYNATRQVAEKSEWVLQKLHSLFGVSSVAECDGVKGRGLILHVIKANLRHPFKCLASVLGFLYTFVRNYIVSNTGFSVGFTGPDGVGKTTVINETIRSLGDVFSSAHLYCHFRPSLFGNLGEVAHSAGIKRSVDRNYDRPHRSQKQGFVSSFLRLSYYTIDYILGYFFKVKANVRITRLVVFDRYYSDIICDSRRSCIYLSPKFLYWFGRLFIPSLSYNILLTASTDVILSRKNELDKDGVESIKANIEYLATKKGYLKVVNDNGPHECVMAIVSHIFASQHHKNMSRLS